MFKSFCNYFFYFSSALILISVFSCSSTDTATGSYQSVKVYEKPLFSKIVKKSIAYEGVAKNPVIIVHGFLGSKLQNLETGKDVWGYISNYQLIRGYSDKQYREMHHPMDYGVKLKDIKSNVKPVSMLNDFDVKIFFMKFSLNAYNGMINVLEHAGYVSEGVSNDRNKKYDNLFQYYYDWRRDNVENASNLHDFILEKRKYMQDKYAEVYGIKDFDVQFDIVAHSMGGLVARYYLRYGNQDMPEGDLLPKLDWRGGKYIDKVIIVGTPNAGYLDTVIEMTDGLKINPKAPAYPPAVIGTFPSYYQMMPLLSTKSVVYEDDYEGKPVNLFDPDIWIKLKWGIVDPNQDDILKVLLPEVKSKKERRKIAVDHLIKCLKRAKKFTDALKVVSTPEVGVTKFLYLGDAVKTSSRATVNKTTGKLKVVEYDSGDGKVLASSAIMDNREGQKWSPFFSSPINWKEIYHLKAAHMGITECYTFADDITYNLLITPTDKQRERIAYIKKAEQQTKKKR